MGSILMAHALNVASSAGKDMILAPTKEARPFYEKLGFEQDKMLKGMMRVSHDRIPQVLEHIQRKHGQ